jgi:hypothetical protein
MADLFVTIVSIVPKPSTFTVDKPKDDKGNSLSNGTFTGLQQGQLQTPGK